MSGSLVIFSTDRPPPQTFFSSRSERKVSVLVSSKRLFVWNCAAPGKADQTSYETISKQWGGTGGQ